MKKILIALVMLLANDLLAQSTLSKYEKFVSREGALILTSSEEIYTSGGLESFGISYAEAGDVTRNGETIKAIVITINKSSAYMSKGEVEKLVTQMKKIQLLLVDGTIEKEQKVSFNIRNNLLIEVSHNESKNVWKYGLGVSRDGKKKVKEVTATEFQDIKAMLEERISKW